MKIDDLVPVLSTAFKKEQDSNNYKLLGTVLRELEAVGYGDDGYGQPPWGGGLEDILQRVKEAHWINYASGKSSEHFAQLFNITRNAGETDMHFRMRIKLQHQKHLSHATIDEIRAICAVILYSTTSRVLIEEGYPAAFDMTIYQQDLAASGVSATDFKTLMNEIKPAAVQISILKQLGTFEYMGIGGASDSTKGYNNIANSNPNGGTYAGLI